MLTHDIIPHTIRPRNNSRRNLHKNCKRIYENKIYYHANVAERNFIYSTYNSRLSHHPTPCFQMLATIHIQIHPHPPSSTTHLSHNRYPAVPTIIPTITPTITTTITTPARTHPTSPPYIPALKPPISDPQGVRHKPLPLLNPRPLIPIAILDTDI